MPGILEKLCWGRTIGVYFCAGRISITDVGNTIKGSTILNQQTFEAGDKDSMQFLTCTLQEYIKNHGGKNASVCFGLKPEQTFFLTSRAECEQQEKLRDKLLDCAGFRSAEERSGVAGDYFKINKIKSHSGQLWSIGVCKKEITQQLYNAIKQAGFRNVVLKPTPWCLSKLPMKVGKKNKTLKAVIQIFLSETGFLAVLAAEKNPICWKRIDFSQAEPVEKIESAVRSLLIQNAMTLGRPRIDGIVIEGPNAGVLGNKISESLGIEVTVAEGTGFNDVLCSYALAMSARSDEMIDFDMFRELRGKPSIAKMFPLKQAAMVALAACFMAFMMWQRASSLAEDYRRFKRQNAEHKWALTTRAQELAKSRQDLLTETEAVEKFIKTRIIWSDYLRDLPTRLPPNVSLSNIWAMCEYQESGTKEIGRKKAGRTLTMKGETMFEEGHASPEEIDAFLESLKKVELLQRDFPKIQLAEIRWRRSGRNEVASFTILAMPKKSDKGDKSGKGGAEEAKKG